MSLLVQLTEAATMSALLPAYVPEGEPTTTGGKLTLRYNGADAIVQGTDSWRHITAAGTSGLVNRAAIVALLSDLFRPVPRVVEVVVGDQVFGGAAAVATPGGMPGAGQVVAKVVEVLPE